MHHDQEDGLWLAITLGSLLGFLLYQVSAHHVSELLQWLLRR